MKKQILALIIMNLFVITSCDSPRDRRANLKSGSMSNGLNFNNENRTDTGNSNNNNNNNNSNANIPSDAKHCNFSEDGQNNFKFQGSHISSYNVCKSSTDKNTFYVQIKDANNNNQGQSTVNICLIPMTSSNGSAIHIGNPQCGVFTDNKTVRKITFVKLSQYSNANINSIMIFKDLKYLYPGYGVNYPISTLSAYSTCMSYLNYYGNSYYCQAFKSAGYYSMFNE
jgi:hypothetical protein